MTTTYQDTVTHLIDYLGGTSGTVDVRDAKRAMFEAYRDVANAHRWSYLLTHGRVTTNAPFQTTGTIQYQATAGTYPRQVTLTGDVWPSWAAGAYLRVGNVNCKVAQLVSATVLVLDAQVCPATDLPAGTVFNLYCDSYLLPPDYVGQDQATYECNFGGILFVPASEWLYGERFILSEGVPCRYTITGDTLWPGRLVLRVSPAPSDQRSIDYIYHRRPRALATYAAQAGTASMTSGQAVVTGVGTAFTEAMEGSVFRASGNAKPPTSEVGDNPAVFESRIVSVVSPTQAVVTDVAPFAVSAAAYVISDPIDLEAGAMLNAFLRRCEACLANLRTLKDKPNAQKLYLTSLAEARSADSRSFAGRVAGVRGGGRLPLRYRGPITVDPAGFIDTVNYD